MRDWFGTVNGFSMANLVTLLFSGSRTLKGFIISIANSACHGSVTFYGLVNSVVRMIKTRDVHHRSLITHCSRNGSVSGDELPEALGSSAASRGVSGHVSTSIGKRRTVNRERTLPSEPIILVPRSFSLVISLASSIFVISRDVIAGSLVSQIQPRFDNSVTAPEEPVIKLERLIFVRLVVDGEEENSLTKEGLTSGSNRVSSRLTLDGPD